MHRRLPVTLIGGFLGAGKTSVLHHFLSEHAGGHLALIVESSAAINPDAGALRGLCGAMGRKYDVVEEIGPTDEPATVLLERLRGFAQAGRYERVLMEVSGTTDAAFWARKFSGSGDDQDSPAAWATVEQVLCVVDLLDFFRRFATAQPARDPLGDFQRGQIENATLIILNKCDLLGDAERRQCTQLLRVLNREARIVETDYGEVAPELLLRPRLAGFRSHERTPSSDGTAPSFAGVAYRLHRPFHPARFWDWFNAPHPGLLRVKGLAWLATRNLLVGGLSRTVWQNGCGAAGIWWAALPREEWPLDTETLAKMQADWREPYGDRRQELVLIGESGPTETAARQLNNCLLNGEEYARPIAEWPRLPDPFPAWDLETDQAF